MERHFSLSDLRDLFKLEEQTLSDTHDKLALIQIPVIYVGHPISFLHFLDSNVAGVSTEFRSNHRRKTQPATQTYLNGTTARIAKSYQTQSSSRHGTLALLSPSIKNLTSQKSSPK